MDTTVPRKALVAVAVILALMSLIGAYQGWRRAGMTDSDSDTGPPSLTAAPVAGAKTASALAEPPAVNLTEQQVRDIARQEVRNVLGQKSASASSDGEDGAAGKPLAPAAAPVAVPPPPAPGPTLQTPVAPAPASQGQAPLF